MTNTEIIELLKKRGVLPSKISPAQMQALERSLQRYAEYISQDGIQKALDKIQSGLKDVMNPQQVGGVTTGPTEGALRGSLSNLINQFSTVERLGQSINLDFIIGTATKILGGAGRFVADTTPAQVALYPAWAFSRFAPRDVPRGFKEGKKGALIPVEDDDWPSRWADAGEASADDDWLDWHGDAQTGRGVALKSSDIWNQLGDVRDDSLGNAFPPFAFNSGFDVGPVSRAECIDLGLIDPKDEVNPPEFNLGELIQIPEAA